VLVRFRIQEGTFNLFKEFVMVRYIHYSRLLAKQLRGLRKTGKKAELAANRCEAILNDIKQSGCQCETVLGKRTRYGELRMKSCVKYHLGSGYRLVTIRADAHLFSCFVGDHDDTDQWIELHRYDDLAPGDPLYRCEERVPTSDTEATTSCETHEIEDIEDSYEDELRARLDESLLKSIFQGLFVNSAPESDKTSTSKIATHPTCRANESREAC
jgi:hypothetical protein